MVDKAIPATIVPAIQGEDVAKAEHIQNLETEIQSIVNDTLVAGSNITLVENAGKITINSTSANNGFIDYNDLATSTTPINVSAGVWTDLTNDGLGPFTNRTYSPPGVTDLWDVSTNQFDWSELKLGDLVLIRSDIVVTTTSNNETIRLRLQLAVGGGTYEIEVGSELQKKLTGSVQLTPLQKVYMGDLNTRDNPAKLQILTDSASTVVVAGWVVTILST